MDDLRKAAEMVLKALEEINKLSVGENAICLPAEIDGAMEAFRQALAKEEQEPVGYAHVEDLKREHHDFYVNRERGVNEVPLYAAPPKRKWVGLTDEEIADSWSKSKGDVLYRLVPFARAIEAKLREKNHG